MSTAKKSGIISDIAAIGAAGNGIKSFAKIGFDEKNDDGGEVFENMIISGGEAHCLASPSVICGNISAGDGVSFRRYDGTVFFACGTAVYKINRDGSAACIGNNAISSGAGAFYEFDGGLYLTDGEKIVEVRENSCVSHDIYVPMMYKNCSSDGSSYTSNEAKNLFSPYVELKYNSISVNGLYTPRGQTVTEFISLRNNLGLDMTGNYRATYLSDGRLYLSGNKDSRTVTIRVALADESQQEHQDAKTAFLSSHDMFDVTLGGESKKMFFYNGKVYILALTDYGYVTEEGTSADIPSGITKVIPYDGGWYLFSPDKIYRMYFGEEEEIVITPVACDFGCDVPESISCDETKIIFMNSARGLYCFGKYGADGEEGIFRISYNIKEFLDGFATAQLKNAKGICTKSNYYLFVGDMIFIWKWDKEDKLCLAEFDDEKKLEWKHLSGVSVDSVAGYNINTVFIVSDGSLKRFEYSKYSDDSLLGTYSSGRLFPKSFEKRVLCQLNISAKITGTATLSVFYDGKATPDVYSVSGDGEEKIYRIRLPAREFYSFALVLSGYKTTLYGYEMNYYSA